jgi:photosystem II stability/assembly factor-like uncharacterized protein
MTDDELIERLSRSLKAHASTVSSPPDAWSDFALQAGHTLPSDVDRRRPGWWLPTAVVATAAAVAAAALFVVLRSPPTRPSKINVASPPPAVTLPPVTGPPASAGQATVAPPAVATTVPLPQSGPPGGPVPKGFSPVSVSFVSLKTGWVLGTAPCSSPPCTSLVRTNDGGKTWVGIPAPRTPLSPGYAGSGVRQVRFASPADGWVFGPELWATHDGGAHWHQVTIKGAPAGSAVVALEAASGQVHAAVLGGGGVMIASTAPDQDSWQASPTTVPFGAGPIPNAQIVLQGTTGWLIEVDRTVVGGARFDQGRWATWQPPCAAANGPATLAASSATAVVAVCNEGVWGPPAPADRVYLSSDGGQTFHPAAKPSPLPGSSVLGSVASPSPQTIVLGANTATPQLVASFDAGKTWRSVAQFRQQSSSWAELGFTSPTQGVAVLVSSVGGPSGTLLMTTDGGHTWHPVAFRQAHS